MKEELKQRIKDWQGDSLNDGLETRGLTENKEAEAIVKQMKDNYRKANPLIAEINNPKNLLDVLNSLKSENNLDQKFRDACGLVAEKIAKTA